MMGHGTYNMPKGTWSDDSNWLLQQCRALLREKQSTMRIY